MPVDLVQRLLQLLVVVLSLTVHEYFHAWAAWRLGDGTARQMGLLTLNPIPHIDLVGTVLLPLFAPLGWARPTPVNPSNFRRGIPMRAGDALVSIAGPLSNLGLALLAALVHFGLLWLVPGAVSGGVQALLGGLVLVNVGLFLLNLLPIPPLDGGRVFGALLPESWQAGWTGFARFGPLLLLALLLVNLPGQPPLLWKLLGPPTEYVTGLVLARAGLVPLGP